MTLIIAIIILVAIQANATPITATCTVASAQCQASLEATTATTTAPCNRNHMPLDPYYIDAIKRFEGFTPKASWDYRQYSNGYGTKAAHPGEIVDQATAEKRLADELTNAAGLVDKRFPELPSGARAALTSLTYNAGPAWMNSGLAKAVENGDWAQARSIFEQYNRAGGQVLPGLANRRKEEAAWLVGAQGPTQEQPNSSPVAPQETGQLPAAALMSAATPMGVPSQSQQQQQSGAALANYGLQLMQPQVQPMQFPQMQPMQLQRPQVDFSGLQRLLSQRRFI